MRVDHPPEDDADERSAERRRSARRRCRPGRAVRCAHLPHATLRRCSARSRRQPRWAPWSRAARTSWGVSPMIHHLPPVANGVPCLAGRGGDGMRARGPVGALTASRSRRSPGRGARRSPTRLSLCREICGRLPVTSVWTRALSGHHGRRRGRGAVEGPARLDAEVPGGSPRLKVISSSPQPLGRFASERFDAVHDGQGVGADRHGGAAAVVGVSSATSAPIARSAEAYQLLPMPE